MSFEHPQGLWLLTLGIPILVFHFYKGRVRRMPVPTLAFWEQVIIEEERKTALRKLFPIPPGNYFCLQSRRGLSRQSTS